MTPGRRKLVAVISLYLCVLVLCAFFDLRSGPHHSLFGVAMFIPTLLINLWSHYQYGSKRRQPDTLIHLFPAPPEISEERS
jgi:hypothetical protein